ncbi:hypothetical protein [Streptomyces sp. NPDC048269]|uniref:hypothetical protein n=1 Tax=Streptomyces sp. NPDC048269 TaxID=3155753 RepID=UPI00343C1BCC
MSSTDTVKAKGTWAGEPPNTESTTTRGEALTRAKGITLRLQGGPQRRARL